jgi:DNA repair protein RadC
MVALVHIVLSSVLLQQKACEAMSYAQRNAGRSSFSRSRSQLGAKRPLSLAVSCLDTKNHVVSQHTVYQGTVNTSVVRAAEVFRPAVSRNCPGIIVVHNHPSGDPTPSPEDIRTTEQVRKAGEALEIELLDHIILGQQRYVSLKERGLGF